MKHVAIAAVPVLVVRVRWAGERVAVLPLDPVLVDRGVSRVPLMM